MTYIALLTPAIQRLSKVRSSGGQIWESTVWTRDVLCILSLKLRNLVDSLVFCENQLT
jgi:hypothetical protein